MSSLWAGPWCGEFGFEITSWQSCVRQRADGYTSVIVGCRPESRALYNDFATEFWDVPNVGDALNTNCDRRVDGGHVEIVRSFNRQARRGGGEIMPGKMQHPDGRWRVFGNRTKGLEYDLLLHARWMRKGSKGGDMRRSAPQDWWDRLGARLLQKGYNVASIGLASQALHVAGTHHIMDCPLQVLMDVMASSRCVLGASSGPIHLAAMCKLPAVVWTDTKHKGYGGLTNKQRLLKSWNPFKAPVKLIHVTQDAHTQYWTPDPNVVVDKVEEMMNAQARRVASTFAGEDPMGAGSVQ